MKIERPTMTLAGKEVKAPEHISMKTWRAIEKWAEDYAKQTQEKVEQSPLDEIDSCLDNLALIYGIDRDTIEGDIAPEDVFPTHAKAVDYVRTRIYKALEALPQNDNAKNG